MIPVNRFLNRKPKPCTKWKQEVDGHLKCCRTCLSTKDLKYLFSESESMKTIIKSLKLITGLEVKQTDGLSQKICSRCIKILEMAVEFRYRSHKTYNLLLKLKEIKSEKNINNETKTCWIEVEPFGTYSKFKTEKFGSNYVDDDKFDNNDTIDNNDQIDNKYTFDVTVKIEDNDKSDNSNNFEVSNDDVGLKKKDAAKDLEEKKPLKRRQQGPSIPIADIYKCEVCDKEFTHRTKFQCHVRLHTKFVVCELCGKKCRDAITLKSHMGAIHGFEKKYKCDECDYSNAYAEPLRIHQRLHTGEKPFQCDHCGDSFNRRATLIQHITRHTVFESKIKCPSCPKTFRTPRHLHSHKYRVHRKKDYRYGCTICERTYNRSCLVQKHARKVHNVKIESIRKIPIESND